jgi:hypothetical protein
MDERGAAAARVSRGCGVAIALLAFIAPREQRSKLVLLA